MEKFFGTQGHVTPNWLVQSGQDLNSSEILCLPGLQQIEEEPIKIECTSMETLFPYYKSMEICFDA